MSEQRLVDLEAKFSYQDILIEELRQTVHEQYLLIQKIEKALKTLTEKQGGTVDDINTSHEKPPHY